MTRFKIRSAHRKEEEEEGNQEQVSMGTRHDNNRHNRPGTMTKRQHSREREKGDGHRIEMAEKNKIKRISMPLDSSESIQSETK
jgi:hypothetical protein